MQTLEVFGQQDVLDQKMLLRKLLRDGVLKKSAKKFHKQWNYIAMFKYLQTILSLFIFYGMRRIVYHFFENLKHLILEYYSFATKNSITWWVLSQQSIQTVRIDRRVDSQPC